MHIAVCGPATLSDLQDHVSSPITTVGYPFPGTSALILEYIKRGHRVSVITTGPDVDRPVVYRGERLDIHVIPSRGRARERALDFFAFERRGIVAALREVSPDVVHAHWTYEFGLAARSSGFPSLVTVHDWAPAIAKLNRHPYWYFRAAMQVRCLSQSGATTAPSAYIAYRVSKYYKRVCTVVGNGFELDRYAGERNTDSERIHVGMLNVGFSARKNVKTAIDAWPEVRRALPVALLHLAGPEYHVGGPAWKYAMDHGLQDGIVFEGPVAYGEVPMWFRTKDLFLHTSLEESFGMVLGEAMASGTPVIAGIDSGAVAEVTKGAAVLVNIRSAAVVSQALVDTLGDPKLLESLVAKGKRAAESFSLSSVADKYLEILHNCQTTT